MTEHLVNWDGLPIVDAPGGVAKRRIAIGGSTLVSVSVPAGTVAARHAHPHGQFVQVVSGTGTLTTEQGEAPFGPGSVFVFPAETWHAARFDTDTVLIESNLPV